MSTKMATKMTTKTAANINKLLLNFFWGRYILLKKVAKYWFHACVIDGDK